MGLRIPGFGGLLAISGAVAALDQVTKWLIAAFLAEGGRTAVLPFFDLVRWHNTGAAFGFLSNAPGWQNGLFLILGTGLLVYLGLLMRKASPRDNALWAAGLALMAGGAAGNLIDRAARGYVLDFLLLHHRDWSFPAFNVADSALTIGVILVLANALFPSRPKAGT